MTTCLLLLSLAACNGGSSDAPAAAPAADKAQAADANRSPGKPSAPIDIRYKILGTPVVGQPVAIEIELATSLTGRPLDVSYFINDSDSLMFPDAQPQRISLAVPEAEKRAARQVTVVPQREGRVYLNVTVEMESDAGMVLKSMSIPLVVGFDAAAPEMNGELVEGADGETVISMPAQEN